MFVTEPLSREAAYLLEVVLKLQISKDHVPFFSFFFLLPVWACLWDIKQSRRPTQTRYLSVFSIFIHIQSFVFWKLGWGTANPEADELQKAANSGYVKSKLFVVFLIFIWILIVPQTIYACLTRKLLLCHWYFKLIFESQTEHPMAPSLMKPPNASKFNLANAGKNLAACRLVKSLMSIILPFLMWKCILHFPICL